MRTMRALVVVFLMVSLWFGFGDARKLPSYVHVCKANDPDLSACWRKSFESLRPYMKKELPEINLPRIDPLRLQEIKLIQNEGTRNLFLNTSLFDAEFTGPSNFEVLDAHVQLEPYFIHLRIRFPQFIMKSKYKAQGKILLFEFDSEGEAVGNFSNIIYNGSWTGSTYVKKGKEHIKLETKGVDVEVGNIYIYLGNLFKDNPEITENVNQSINDNIDLLYQDFLPVLKKTLDTIIVSYSNRFYSTFPKEVLYPTN